MKNFNNVDLKGRLYNFNLSIMDTEKGEAISGEIQLEVDSEGTVVPVRFFGYPTYNSGKPNKTYSIMSDIMDGDYKTVVDDGEDADWLAISASIDIGYFEARNSNELARAQKIRGSFINPNKDKAYKNKWKLDCLITKITDIDADEEKMQDRYVRVSGYLIDSYNGRVMEVQFQARAEAAMNYIVTLDASKEMPYFVSVWGKISKVKRIVTRDNAFGEPEQEEYSSTQWVVTGMATSPYDWDEEKTIKQETYEKYVAALQSYKEEIENKNSSAKNEDEDDDLPF